MKVLYMFNLDYVSVVYTSKWQAYYTKRLIPVDKYLVEVNNKDSKTMVKDLLYCLYCCFAKQKAVVMQQEEKCARI